MTTTDVNAVSLRELRMHQAGSAYVSSVETSDGRTVVRLRYPPRNRTERSPTRKAVLG